MSKVEQYIRTIPDFPEEGIMFRDITSVLQSPEGFKIAIDEMTDLVSDLDFDSIAGLEARGFIFGPTVAYKLGKGFALIRKKGKLPCETIEKTYDLEYGTATIEIHKDAMKPGEKVILVDDLLATGGTCKAAIDLVERLGAEVVCCLFLIELEGLNGREALKDYDVRSVVKYEGK